MPFLTYVSNFDTTIVYNFRNCRNITTDFVTIFKIFVTIVTFIYYFVTRKVKYNIHYVTLSIK